jgi:hypothetical protein
MFFVMFFVDKSVTAETEDDVDNDNDDDKEDPDDDDERTDRDVEEIEPPPKKLKNQETKPTGNTRMTRY